MKKLLFVLATAALLFTGCVKDISEALWAARSVGPEPTLSEQGANVEQNVNGLEQTQALADSVLVAWGLDSIVLEPTDLYVRFLVKTEDEYDLLASLPDSLELFDFPFHLDLTTEQMDAFANDDSDGGYWFYTTVPLNFVFPHEIQYEELDQMYLQRFETEGAQLPDEVWEAMLEAMFADANDGPLTRADPYHPKVTLTYKIDHPAYKDSIVGLEGVKVRFWVGGISGKAYTNANGEINKVYRDIGGRFTAKVNSQIIWENSRWNIRSGAVTQATTWGQTKSRAHWKKTFGGDTKTINHVYAAVHKALYTYFYKSKTLEFAKDIRISSEKKMNTRVFDEVGGADYYDYGADISNRVRIWGKHKNDKTNEVKYRPYWETEQIVYHELGHASHHELIGHTAYRDRNEHTKEPYAEFVSNCFMRSIYPGHIQGYYGIEGQRNRDKDNPEWYNGLGEWLWYQGFTVKQIATIIMKGGNLDAWKNTAKNHNVTDPVIIDAVFDSRWSNWRFNAKDIIIAPETVFPGEVTIKRHPDTNIPWYVYEEFGAKDERGHPILYPTPNNTSISSHSWDISNMDGVSISDTPNYQRIVLNFTKPGTYTISYDANLSSNVRYSYPKTIKVVNAAPVIVASESGVPLWRDEYGKYPVYYNNNITFEVIDPVPGLYYEWEYNMNTDTLGEGLQGKPKITTSVGRVGNANPTAYMRCRAIDDAGVATEWSNRIEMPLMF